VGLSAFGVAGVEAGAELTEAQFEMARRLIRGQHIGTGEQLVEPKVSVPVAAKVGLEPLVAGVRQRAIVAGVATEELFTGPVRKARDRRGPQSRMVAGHRCTRLRHRARSGRATDLAPISELFSHQTPREHERNEPALNRGRGVPWCASIREFRALRRA
jgi:hypothetical protein